MHICFIERTTALRTQASQVGYTCQLYKSDKADFICLGTLLPRLDCMN